jgi:hypothetical protein
MRNLKYKCKLPCFKSKCDESTVSLSVRLQRESNHGALLTLYIKDKCLLLNVQPIILIPMRNLKYKWNLH